MEIFLKAYTWLVNCPWTTRTTEAPYLFVPGNIITLALTGSAMKVNSSMAQGPGTDGKVWYAF